MATATLPAKPRSGDPSGEHDRLTNPEALCEVVDGVQVELPEMSVRSNIVKSRLHSRLAPFVEQHNLGIAAVETMFILDAKRDLQRRPDVAFVSFGRWPAEKEIPWEGEWEVIPDLCVEVTSPTDLFHDVLAKTLEYLSYGVHQVWVVSPVEQQIHVYESPRKVSILGPGDTLTCERLPGFALPVADLFPKLTTPST